MNVLKKTMIMAKFYANLISKILAEIEDNQMKIADLEIALQEN